MWNRILPCTPYPFASKRTVAAIGLPNKVYIACQVDTLTFV
jgi:hypothetical protein